MVCQVLMCSQKLLTCSKYDSLRHIKLATTVNLEKVYTEMKRVRRELKSIEETLDYLAESLIPTEETSPEELRALKVLRREATGGECVSLEAVLKKHAKKKDA
jgi:hypothetical protein